MSTQAAAVVSRIDAQTIIPVREIVPWIRFVGLLAGVRATGARCCAG